MNKESIVVDMKNCPQTQNQSVYDHGISVNQYFWNLHSILTNGDDSSEWRIPSWLSAHKDRIVENLLSAEIINDYTIFHDCGKPYCRTVDEDGRQHFPYHAQVSHDTWLEMSEDMQVARLILFDMDIHLMKNDDVPIFCAKTTLEEACTLLLVSLSELHSNASMFGKEGTKSTSFKIKFKQIEKRGKAICKTLFEGDKK